MNTQLTQIKVTLPDPLHDLLSDKAGRFGLSLSSYVKNLILNDVKDLAYPEYQASEKIEKSYIKALNERNKALKVTNIDEVFEKI